MPSLSYTCPCYHLKRKRIFICKKISCKIWTCDFIAHRKGSKAKTSSSYSLLWTPKGKFTNYPGEQKMADREAKKTATDLMTIKDVCVCVCVCVQLLSHVQLFETPWTAAFQAPLIHGISQASILEWLPYPSPGDLPDSAISGNKHGENLTTSCQASADK